MPRAGSLRRWAKATPSLCFNVCLRRYGREYESLLPPLDDNPVTATSHPKWLVKMLTQAGPNTGRPF